MANEFNFNANPGAFNLGAILAGGGRVREAAKTAEETRLIQRAALQAETDRKVDQAREEMLQRTGVEGVANDTTMAPLVRALTLGKLGSEFSGATEGQLHQQQFDNRDAAVKAFIAGHADEGNAHLAGVASGPLQLTKVEDGNVIRNPYSVDGGVTPTEQGRANITAAQALAGERNAHAGLYDTQTAAGGFNPRTGAGAGKPGKFTAAPENMTADFDATDFARWRDAHPEVPDGAQAANMYRLALANRGPHIIDPRLPGSMSITPPNAVDAERIRLTTVPGAKPLTAADAEIASIEHDIGRPLTAPEQAQYRATGTVPTPDVHPIAAALAGAPAAPSDGFQAFELPPAAHAQLKPGIKTKFGNGQVWTLVAGKPVRVQ